MEESSMLKQNTDFSKLKFSDLKKELKNRGLNASGTKVMLVERLQFAAKSKSDDNGSAESIDDLDDDLLNDDDSDHDPDIEVPSESVFKELDEQLDVSPPINSMKRPLESDSPVKSTKKLVLNRKLSVTTDLKEPHKELTSSTAIFSQQQVQDLSATDTPDKKVIKLTNLSAKERLELRAKKFGSPTSLEAKKEARLGRFGTNLPNTVSELSTAKVTPNLDILKKRAERFGGSVSKAMSGLEQQERLELRKARFGESCSTDNKAKQRLERFKTPVT